MGVCLGFFGVFWVFFGVVLGWGDCGICGLRAGEGCFSCSFRGVNFVLAPVVSFAVGGLI